MQCSQCKHYHPCSHKVQVRDCQGYCTRYPKWEHKNESTLKCGEYKNKDKKPRKVKDSGEYTQQFKDFWAVYPKKTDQDAAWRAWNNENNRPCDHAEYVIAQAEAYSVLLKIEDKDMKYVKHPATFLNGGSWKNEFKAKTLPTDCYLCGASYEKGHKYPFIDGKTDTKKRICKKCRQT